MLNNWYVITGGPCAGKTSTIEELSKKGYAIVPEAARIFIDQEIKNGKNLTEIRKNELQFQKAVLKMKQKIEKKISPAQITFFDRGIPDSAAYYEIFEAQRDSSLQRAVLTSHYKKIFLLDLLPYQGDYARTENEHLTQRIHLLLEKSYQHYGQAVIKVPVMSVDERVKFILNRL